MPPKTPAIPKNFRLSPETLRQLHALAAAWGETETAVVSRAIAEAYSEIRERARIREMQNRVYHGPAAIEPEQD